MDFRQIAALDEACYHFPTTEPSLGTRSLPVVAHPFMSSPSPAPMSHSSSVNVNTLEIDNDDLSGDEFLDDDDDAVNYGHQGFEEDVERDAPSPYYPGIDVCIVRVMRY